MLTDISVMNVNAGMSRTMVVSGANSGGNTIMAESLSTGGDSGNSARVSAGAGADAGNRTDVEDVTADDAKEYSRYKQSSTEGGDATVDATSAGDASALAGASSRTGNAGSAGNATTRSSITTDDAVSDVVVMGGTDSNEVVIDLPDTDRKNTYHEESLQLMELSASSEYYNYYRAVEESYEEEGSKGYRGNGGSSEEWYEEEESAKSGSSNLDLTTASEWSVSKTEYAPVTTIIRVANANLSADETTVLSGANSGMNSIFARSASIGGDSGNSTGVSAGAGAGAHNSTDVDDVYSKKGDATVDAGAYGDADALADTESQTGTGGASSDAETENIIVSGRSASVITVVETSRHNVVRIRR
jgi:hypothetical protein